MIFLSLLILIVAVALPSINKNINSILYIRITSIIFIYSGALSLNALYIQSIGSGIGIYSGLFHVTTISQLLDIIIFTIGSLILISWPKLNTEIVNDLNILTNYRKHNCYNYVCEYSLIVLFSSFGASLLVSSADLISVYLSIELQSFAVYILSTLYRDSESSTSAGLKYFLLGGFSSCLILLGCGLIYSFTGLTNLESIYSFVSVSDSNNIIQAISLGILFIFLGFLFKIAAAPLHNWAPDVYDDTPTIVTIWLTIMPKISIIIFLLELHTQLGIIGNNLNISELVGVPLINNLITDNITNLITNLLLISSLISLIIGTIVGLAQSRIKRLLAYSTISHIGFMLLALAINTEQSIDSLIFYIIQYSITNLNTFLIILGFGYIINNSSLTRYYGKQETRKDIKYISELKGQFFANPLLSIALTICLFSMAGIPPLIGFFSKQFVLYSAIQSGYYFMAIIAIVVSVISASYYLKIIRVMHSQNNSEIFNYNINKNYSEFTADLTNYHSYLISTLTLSILFFFIKPSILLNSTQLLSLSLFNF